MAFNPNRHHRRSIRLPGYNYTQPGAYFVTVCTIGRTCMFGQVQDDAMHLSDAGAVVAACWRGLPQHFAHIALDVFVVMPNHLHGIIIIRSGDVAADETVTQRALPNGTAPSSISAVIQNFKSVATRKVRQLSHDEGTSIWQRNYHEHIIRDEAALNAIRLYIDGNPARWGEDEENPARTQ